MTTQDKDHLAAPGGQARACFTPGPWKFDGVSRIDAVALRKPTGTMLENDDGTQYEYIGGLVALPYSCRPSDDYSIGSHEANAHLIAASPLMYEALRTLLEVWPNTEKEPGWAARWIAAQENARAALSAAEGKEP